MLVRVCRWLARAAEDCRSPKAGASWFTPGNVQPGILKIRQPFSFRSKIFPTNAGCALPLERFMTRPLCELRVPTLRAGPVAGVFFAGR